MPQPTYPISLLTVLFLLSFFISPAQVRLPAALDKLEKARLISDREKLQLVERYSAWKKRKKRPGVESPTPDYSQDYQLLELLTQVKTYSTSGTSHGLGFTPAPASSRQLPDTAIQAEVNTFIQKLSLARLLSARTKGELIRMNRENKFGWEYNVADYARQAANEEYFLRPEKLQRFLEGMRRTGMVSEDNYLALQTKSRNGQLGRFAELLPYLEHFIPIDKEKLPADRNQSLIALYQLTARALPGLQYDSIRFRVQKDLQESAPDFEVYNLVTRIWKEGKAFNAPSFYYSIFKDKQPDTVRIPSEWYGVFNKLLKEHSSPYRLHTVSVGTKNAGIMALTEEQFQQCTWMYDGAAMSYLEASTEQYSNKLTQDKIALAIRAYDSLGLFSHLTPAEKDSGMVRVNLGEMNHYSDVLQCFKDLVFDIDLEYGIDSGQYAKITQLLARVSGFRFNPEKIVDGYSYTNKYFPYGFTLYGKTYSASLYQPDDWLDLGFWELIGKAVQENDTRGGFYAIYPTDGLTQIYLTTEQFNYLQNYDLLEFHEP